MKLKYLITLLAVLGSTAHAQAINNSWDGCETGRCELSSEAKRKTAANLAALQRSLNATNAASKPAARSTPPKQSIQVEGMQKITDGAVAASEQLEKTSIGQVDKCDMFAGNDEFGRAGEAFLKEIQKEEQIVSRNSEYGGEKKTRKVFEKLWEGPEDLRKLCVNYGTEKMTTDDKNALWVVIAAGISFIESTCDASESLKQTNGRNYGAPNGTAHGLVQLHLNDEAKYTSSSAILQLLPDLSADQVAARRCRNGDSKNPERTMTCAAKMLNLQLLRSSVNDDRGQLFSSNWSYWSSLKARGREGSHNGYKKTKGLPPAQYIMKNICENKACGNDIPKCMQIAKQITNAPTRLATTSAKKVRVASSRSAK